MEVFELLFADILVPLPYTTELALTLHRLAVFIHVIAPAETGILAVYYFWKRRKADYDPSRVLFFIGLCAYIHALISILILLLLTSGGVFVF
jgi:hypothetical protein